MAAGTLWGGVRQPLEPALGGTLDHGRGQVLLAREEPVDGAGRQPGLATDRRDPGAREAALAEQVLGGVEDPGAGLLAIYAGRCAARLLARLGGHWRALRRARGWAVMIATALE